MWGPLKNDCPDVVLNDECDRYVWTLTKSGLFSVKSMYNAIKARKV